MRFYTQRDRSGGAVATALSLFLCLSARLARASLFLSFFLSFFLPLPALFVGRRDFSALFFFFKTESPLAFSLALEIFFFIKREENDSRAARRSVVVVVVVVANGSFFHSLFSSNSSSSNISRSSRTREIRQAEDRFFFFFPSFVGFSPSHSLTILLSLSLSHQKNKQLFIYTIYTRAKKMVKKNSYVAIGAAAATLMALAPTAVQAAASYGTTAQSCEYLQKGADCAGLATSSACVANTDCAWNTENSECSITEALQQDFLSVSIPTEDDSDYIAAGEAFASCLMEDFDDECPTSTCEWLSESGQCILNEATVNATITNSLGAFNLYRSKKCEYRYYMNGTACLADPHCEIDEGGESCTGKVSIEDYLSLCPSVNLPENLSPAPPPAASPASRVTKVSAVVSTAFVAGLALFAL